MRKVDSVFIVFVLDRRVPMSSGQTDSVDKIIQRYFPPVTKHPFTFRGEEYRPKRLKPVSHVTGPGFLRDLERRQSKDFEEQIQDIERRYRVDEDGRTPTVDGWSLHPHGVNDEQIRTSDGGW